ncbi:MAG: Crp/Fnr family transcriptional regulator [Burkholderiales bacterium]
MLPIKPALASNRLLAALPRKEREHFLAGCKTIDLISGEVLTESGERIRQVYFPTSGIIYRVTPIEDHTNLEVGLIGDEGMLGASLILGVNVSPLRSEVLSSGSALLMSAATFRRELELSSALKRLLKRYLYVVKSQLAQTAACSLHHVMETRLARLLLMMQERVHLNKLHVTHELLAQMLGVRRVGVTKAAASLRNHNLISYSRGNIMILDRSGLEAASCSCFKADKATYTQIMG